MRKFLGRMELALTSRANKIKALDAINNPDSRKARKQMNTHLYHKGKVNTTGFYEKSGKSPCKCKSSTHVNPKFL